MAGLSKAGMAALALAAALPFQAAADDDGMPPGTPDAVIMMDGSLRLGPVMNNRSEFILEGEGRQLRAYTRDDGPVVTESSYQVTLCGKGGLRAVFPFATLAHLSGDVLADAEVKDGQEKFMVQLRDYLLPGMDVMNMADAAQDRRQWNLTHIMLAEAAAITSGQLANMTIIPAVTAYQSYIESGTGCAPGAAAVEVTTDYPQRETRTVTLRPAP